MLNRLIISVAIFVVSFSSGPVSGQELRRSYEYASPNSTTRIQLYEDQVFKIREMVGRSLVRIYVPGARGSGCYIGKSSDGSDLFLTASHVVGRHRTGSLRFYHGYRCNFRVLGVDSSSDIALLCGVDTDITWEGCPISNADPVVGDAVVGYGYGGDEKIEWIPGKVQDFSYARDRSVKWMGFEYNARPGDSGGPVYSPEGDLVGILWGAERPGSPVGGHTTASIASRIRKFIQSVCPGGRCPPSRQAPPDGRREPDIIPRPNGPEAGDSLDEIRKELEDLQKKIAEIKSCDCDQDNFATQEELDLIRQQGDKVMEQIVIDLRREIDSRKGADIDYDELIEEISKKIASRLYVKIRRIQ